MSPNGVIVRRTTSGFRPGMVSTERVEMGTEILRSSQKSDPCLSSPT